MNDLAAEVHLNKHEKFWFKYEKINS